MPVGVPSSGGGGGRNPFLFRSANVMAQQVPTQSGGRNSAWHSFGAALTFLPQINKTLLTGTDQKYHITDSVLAPRWEILPNIPLDTNLSNDALNYLGATKTHFVFQFQTGGTLTPSFWSVTHDFATWTELVSWAPFYNNNSAPCFGSLADDTLIAWQNANSRNYVVYPFLAGVYSQASSVCSTTQTALLCGNGSTVLANSTLGIFRMQVGPGAFDPVNGYIGELVLPQYTGIPLSRSAVFLPDNRVAVGTSTGQIAFSVNGGATWQTFEGNPGIVNASYPVAHLVHDPETGFIFGYNGAAEFFAFHDNPDDRRPVSVRTRNTGLSSVTTKYANAYTEADGTIILADTRPNSASIYYRET